MKRKRGGADAARSGSGRSAATAFPETEDVGAEAFRAVTARLGWWKWVISIAVVWHVWALLGRPVEFATQGPTGTSPAATVFYAPVRVYAEFTYLNHGYAFFAPDPGPSHLVRATIYQEDGTSEELWFPDLAVQWPRLLYHRHFMLTEFLHNTFQPPEVPPELSEDTEVAARWRQDRERFEAIRGSYAEHLRQRYEAERVELVRVEHQLVGLPEFLYDRQPLNDPELYIDLLDEPPLEPETRLPQFGVPQFGAGVPWIERPEGIEPAVRQSEGDIQSGGNPEGSR